MLKTFSEKSVFDLAKNQFFQSTIISELAFKSKATTGTQIDIASIIVIQNESILEGNIKTLDFSRFSIIVFLSINQRNETLVSNLYLF